MTRTQTSSLNRDTFFRDIIRTLSGTLEDTIGLQEAQGYISVVGHEIGRSIYEAYCEEYGAATLPEDKVAHTLQDLKAKIGGEFEIADRTPSHIEYVNTACPFGEKVIDRPSLCMMTSNVFGYIAAETHGYARIELAETIASGCGRCRVVVHLDEDEDGEGTEYFRSGDIG